MCIIVVDLISSPSSLLFTLQQLQFSESILQRLQILLSYNLVTLKVALLALFLSFCR
ncbi:hypothetical protein Patl1_36854 [Pistacia atlantica]|nr:hypothetical protein Patl1_36854 [Pistacia atlantica]